MDKTVPIQEHLFTGIKRTIPVILLYAIMLALSDIVPFLLELSEYVYLAIVPILAINIIFSKYKFNYVLPALVSGYFASVNETGILGGIIIGILLVLSIDYISTKIDIKKWVVIINIIVTLIFYGLTVYIISPPIQYMLNMVFDYLNGIDQANVLLLVGILSILITIDLGGPFNKVAFAFLIEVFLNGSYQIVGPVLISTTVPQLGLFFAMLLYKSRFSEKDFTQKKVLLLSSMVGLTEGAIAVTFRRIKILPIVVFGSFSAAIFAAVFHMENRLLLNSLPGLLGTSNVFMYLVSHAVGVIVILIIFPLVIKKETEVMKNSTEVL